MLRVSPQPMAISPESSPPLWVSSRSAFSASSRISWARRRRSIPSSVSTTRYWPRRKSFTPSSSSSCINWRERVGWVTCSSAAALVMFSSRATARKYRRTRSSMPSASSLFSPVYHAFQASRKVRNVYFV